MKNKRQSNSLLITLIKWIGKGFKTLRVPLFASDFMTAMAWKAPNGDIYTMVKTAPAVVVLPFVKKGNNYEVLLIEQVCSEKMGVILKTIGGYIGETETPERAVVRNLENKADLKIEQDRLISDGRMIGYTVVETPISIFRLELTLKEASQLTQLSDPGISICLMPLEDAVSLAKADEVGDDSTAIPLYKLYCDVVQGLIKNRE
ncbi:MAG: hypothetical protein A2589_02300 [Candidatus Vogelbacteria bacterium RIFOXYD1_FULL_46_19]|uniref:Uncharacterized protein n=1 Tax=Candidatus Vogelbacteria bacterium RIFOXYD1_FULL_46_19 TaxID=1802439 RepID=A0A1G2QGC9_9BACT|nr:MAG: hypothetical protein A2589_02300 [Candidatus Vogelbacteria bacterium RIFOXYD1_FULL_46_19]